MMITLLLVWLHYFVILLGHDWTFGASIYFKQKDSCPSVHFEKLD
jgi:hypothetical protein